MKVVSIKSYKEKRQLQDYIDKVKAMDDLIQWAHEVGVCGTCGALYGSHLPYCEERDDNLSERGCDISRLEGATSKDDSEGNAA